MLVEGLYGFYGISDCNDCSQLVRQGVSYDGTSSVSDDCQDGSLLCNMSVLGCCEAAALN